MGAMKNFAIQIMNEEQERAAFEAKTVVSGTLTVGDLRFWFDRVANAENWKLPIEATLTGMTPTKRRTVFTAIEFFTGSKAEWTRLHGNTWTVRAEGYYAAVGA